MTLSPKPEAGPILEFGRRALNERGYDCCGKPQGCTSLNPECGYLQHPYKRWVRGEISLEDLAARTAR